MYKRDNLKPFLFLFFVFGGALWLATTHVHVHAFE